MGTTNVAQVVNMADIPPSELASILRQGAILRLPYLEARLLQARRQVEQFQERYAMTLEQIEAQGLPGDAGYEMHEDFIEWEYWDQVARETDLSLQAVRRLLERVEAVG